MAKISIERTRNDYLIEIQSEKTFDVSKDILIRLHDQTEQYVDGYMDALSMVYSNKFIHCNKVRVKKASDTYKFQEE